MKFLIFKNLIYSKQLIEWRWSKNCLTISNGFEIQIIKIDNRNFYNFNRNVFLLKSLSLKIFKKFVLNIILGLLFGWLVYYTLIGYHYGLRFSKKKNYLRLNLGFRYKIFIILPSSITIYGERRRFCLFGTNYIELWLVCKYIRFLRNLLPYKAKGLIYATETIKLKQGKKVKYR